MTQRTIYTLMLALGGLMLTLPSFGTSETPIKISSTVDSPTDTVPIICTFFTFHAERVSQGILLEWIALPIPSDTDIELQHADFPTATFPDFSTIAMLDDFVISNELEPGSDHYQFSYVHRSPSNGVNYYRLKVTDASGDISYSSIIAYELDLTPGSIFPSVVDTNASLFIESPAEEPGELNIYDMSGRLIYSENITLNENSTLIGLDFTGWHTGHYVAAISGEQLGNEVIRFVKR